jgi:hypothetical protein
MVGPLFNIRLMDIFATYVVYVQPSSSYLLKLSIFGLVQSVNLNTRILPHFQRTLVCYLVFMPYILCE